MIEPVAFRGTLHHWTLGEPPRLELVCCPTDNAIAQSIALLKGRELQLVIYHKEEKLCTLPAALPPISTVVGKFAKATKIKLDVYPNDMASFLGAIRLADTDGMMRFEFSPGGSLPEKQKREAKPKLERGTHGKFWELLHSFHNRPDVRRWLGFDVGFADERAALDKLYCIFNVTSRTFISPDSLREWVARMPDCDSALTAVEAAKGKINGS